jgi:hypothetical protein
MQKVYLELKKATTSNPEMNPNEIESHSTPQIIWQMLAIEKLTTKEIRPKKL